MRGPIAGTGIWGTRVTCGLCMTFQIFGCFVDTDDNVLENLRCIRITARLSALGTLRQWKKSGRLYISVRRREQTEISVWSNWVASSVVVRVNGPRCSDFVTRLPLREVDTPSKCWISCASSMFCTFGDTDGLQHHIQSSVKWNKCYIPLPFDAKRIVQNTLIHNLFIQGAPWTCSVGLGLMRPCDLIRHQNYYFWQRYGL